VSVVVATVDDHDLTADCLSALSRQTHRTLQIVLVCNGTPRELVHRFRREFPDVVFAVQPDNLGFAGGYNVGLRRAQGEYVAIINNDALAAPDWIEAMLREARRGSHVGAVACTVLRSDDPLRLDSQGVGLALDGMSRQWHRGLPKDHDDRRAPLVASGCAALFRASALREVGLFDESFFAYCEDTDLGLRLLWAGYSTALARDAEVTHRYSMTTGSFSSRKVYWVERNHLWLACKCLPWPLLLALPLTTAWRFALQVRLLADRSTELSGFTAQDGAATLARTVAAAYGAALLGVPRCLRQRRAIIGAAKIRTGAMTRLLWSRRLTQAAVLGGR
jgi:GT2 family glycosyltransferase